MVNKRRIVIEYPEGTDLKEIVEVIAQIWDNDEGCDEYRSWFYFKDETIKPEVK